MSIDDRVLTEIEISYLDQILNNIYQSQPRTLHSFVREWSVLEAYDNSEALESLRIKGIFDIEQRMRTITFNEDGHELSRQVSVQVGRLQPKQLIICWIVTVYFRSGKNITENDIDKITEGNSYYSFPIQVGNDSATIKMITQEIIDETILDNNDPTSMYVSFIGELSLNEQNYLHWFYPLHELSAAARFFAWINEHSKPIMSKQLITLDLPADLDKSDIEHIYTLVKINLINIGFEFTNQPEEYKPESTEYLFSNEMIRAGFINRVKNKKVFLVMSDKRIDIHTFNDGVKSVDTEVSYHVLKLQEWVNDKATKLRNINFALKSSLLGDLARLVPIIISLGLTAFTSFGYIFSENETIVNLRKNNYWFSLQVGINVVAIGIVIYLGLVPSLRHRFFSWNRGFTNYIKRNKKGMVT